MVKNNLVRFLVTKQQLEQLKVKAQQKGFTNLSAYFRDLAFNQDINLDKILFKLHHIECVMKNLEEERTKCKNQT
jgi:hypothetical protein